jgi:hypothetical protein
MTLRLGFCGVGKWARKLAESFRACGAEVVAFDRKGSGLRMPAMLPGAKCGTCGTGLPTVACPDMKPVCAVAHFGACPRCSNVPPGFGAYMPWRDQLADKNIDAIVAVAPPEITTDVVLECSAVGKAVMGTKPLWNHPETIRGPVWVDFWRLWTFGHRDVKEKREQDPSPGLVVNLYGDGPFRDFPGSLDYGPHVLATLLDIHPGLRVRKVEKLNGGAGELFRVQFGPGDITAHFGNAGQGHSDRRLAHGTKNYDTWVESGDNSWGTTKDHAIQAMCRAFMADVTEGIGDPRTLDLSRDGMKLLEQVRRMAT